MQSQIGLPINTYPHPNNVCECGGYADFNQCLWCNVAYTDCGCTDRMFVMRCATCYFKILSASGILAPFIPDTADPKDSSSDICIYMQFHINLLRTEQLMLEYPRQTGSPETVKKIISRMGFTGLCPLILTKNIDDQRRGGEDLRSSSPRTMVTDDSRKLSS